MSGNQDSNLDLPSLSRVFFKILSWQPIFWSYYGVFFRAVFTTRVVHGGCSIERKRKYLIFQVLFQMYNWTLPITTWVRVNPSSCLLDATKFPKNLGKSYQEISLIANTVYLQFLDKHIDLWKCFFLPFNFYLIKINLCHISM